MKLTPAGRLIATVAILVIGFFGIRTSMQKAGFLHPES